MLNAVEALEVILSNISVKLQYETIDIFNCYGRTLYTDQISESDIPPKDNSSMDGYAVLTDDINSADTDTPVCLKVIDEIQAGHTFYGKKLHKGNAIRIMTGASIPEGADSVIQFEATEDSGEFVNIFKKTFKYENIRFAGEDVKKGTTILKKGTRIDSAEIGLLASINLKEIPVFVKPKVAIISTGDELIEPGDKFSEKLINSNAYVLYSEVNKYGGDPFYGGIVKDNYEDVKNMFLRLMNNDIIISSGGVSMGRYDFIPDAFKEIGVDIKVQKVLIKPGKPIIFGTIGDKLFFGLPGNPVSVMVSFMQFVRPAILKMSGNTRLTKPVLKAVAMNDISKEKGRKHFIRGIFKIENGNLFVDTTGPQGSGILTSMSISNCLIIIPEDTELIKSGEFVDIQLTGHSEI